MRPPRWSVRTSTNRVGCDHSPRHSTCRLSPFYLAQSVAGKHLPRIPDGVDAVFLDELDSPEDFETFRRMIRLTTRKPVIGGLDALPAVRAALSGATGAQGLSDEMIGQLAASFRRYADLNALAPSPDRV